MQDLKLEGIDNTKAIESEVNIKGFKQAYSTASEPKHSHRLMIGHIRFQTELISQMSKCAKSAVHQKIFFS